MPCHSHHVLPNEEERVRHLVRIIEDMTARGLFLRHLNGFEVNEVVEYNEAMNEIR